MICVKLKFTNQWDETFYLMDIGKPWPHRPGKFLISETTKDKDKAKCFESAEHAAQALLDCDNPAGWTIVAEDK